MYILDASEHNGADTVHGEAESSGHWEALYMKMSV